MTVPRWQVGTGILQDCYLGSTHKIFCMYDAQLCDIRGKPHGMSGVAQDPIEQCVNVSVPTSSSQTPFLLS